MRYVDRHLQCDLQKGVRVNARRLDPLLAEFRKLAVTNFHAVDPRLQLCLRLLNLVREGAPVIMGDVKAQLLEVEGSEGSVVSVISLVGVEELGGPDNTSAA